MASYQKINGKWRAYVQINGIRRSRYFRTKAEAVRWTQPLEETIRTKGMIPSETKFAVLLDEYYHRVTFFKRGRPPEFRRIRALQKDPLLGKIELGDLTRSVLQAWVDKKVGSISRRTGRPLKSSSVSRYLTIIKAALKKAVEWEYLDKSPAEGVTCRVVEDHRERIATPEEIELLKQVALWNEDEPPVTMSQRIVAAFIFACYTGMRIGEIVMIERSWIKGDLLTIPREITKTFHGRTVALPDRAIKILNIVLKLRHRPQIFGMKPQNHDALWRKIRNMAGLQARYDSEGREVKESLNFHDSRATFCTWAASPGPDGAPRLDVLSLARQTGHRNLRFLMHYYRRNPKEFLERLNS